MDHCRRRLLAAALAALPAAACTTSGRWPGETKLAPPAGEPGVRPAAVGQQWTYRVRDLYNGLLVDEITETVASVGAVTRIKRASSHYGALADEVQSPWGMIVEDPHWPLPVHYATPIALWPKRLEPGQAEYFNDRYELLGEPVCDLQWKQCMRSEGWESVRVIAGEFRVLRFSNRINFQSDDFSRFNCVREEWVRFDPSVGRWAIRRSHGTYDFGDRGSDCYESFTEWELVAWR